MDKQHDPGIYQRAFHSSRGLASFGDPDDVLHDPRMTTAEKRAILARWASDARAVQDVPGLRRLDNGAVVSIDEILTALRSLDEVTTGRPERDRRWSTGRRGALPRWTLTRKARRRDDDDDPPPCPAAAFPLKIAVEGLAA